MMLNIRFREKTNTWPGFVDLFSNLVIILIFLLIVFVFLWTTTSMFNKGTGMKAVAELKKTNEEQTQTITQMTADEQEAKRLLLLARDELENFGGEKAALENKIGALDNELKQLDVKSGKLVAEYESKIAQLHSKEQEMRGVIENLSTQLAQATISQEQNAIMEQEHRKIQTDLEAQRAALAQQLADLQNALNASEAKAATQETQHIEVSDNMNTHTDLEAQRAALAQQLADLQNALDASEAKAAAQEIQYVEMSNRLNKALADKIAALNKANAYQSEFYRAIKDALGDKSSVHQEGDRFIVPSDILFGSGKYALSDEGKNQLRLIANVIKDFENKIPSEINWIIRVDGHTDTKPVVPGTREYSNNIQLSLLRATAVANELEHTGVLRRRLVPSGFGEMHPIELGSDAASLQRNRRIELQLTNR